MAKSKSKAKKSPEFGEIPVEPPVEVAPAPAVTAPSEKAKSVREKAATKKKELEAKEREARDAAIKGGIRDGLREALPVATVMAMQEAGRHLAPQFAPQAAASGKADGGGSQCPTCRQPHMACKGEHVKMVVYPMNPRYGKNFQGVIINGARYLSNSRQHAIMVPKANDIQSSVEAWENNEDEMQNGRVGTHDSGALGKSAGPNGYNPAFSAWR